MKNIYIAKKYVKITMLTKYKWNSRVREFLLELIKGIECLKVCHNQEIVFRLFTLDHQIAKYQKLTISLLVHKKIFQIEIEISYIIKI
jgi:hypothetical protein